MTSRLPVPGQDDGVWGSILNDYLSQAHQSDGSLKPIDQSKITGLTTALDAKADATTLTTGLAAKANATDLSAKADVSALNAGLATKANASDLATVATSGSYNDLSGKPTIPPAGSQALTPTPVKTSAYTASAGDLVPVDASSAAIAITLPAAPPDKSKITIKKLDNSTNAVTVQTGGSDVFNRAGGSTSGTLTLQNQAISLQYATTGSIWYVVGDDVPLASLTTSLNAQYAPISGRGTFASRPSTNLGIGQEWYQTDAAGGNPVGTVTRYNGSSWDVYVQGAQYASHGMQRATWMSPLTHFGSATPTSNGATGAAGGLYGMLMVPRKDITIVSVGYYSGQTANNASIGVYRVDGTTLTRIATTGAVALATVNSGTSMSRIALTASATLTAGTAYYEILSGDAAMTIFGWTNTNRWTNFIGGTIGEVPVFQVTSGSYHPLPATIDTTASGFSTVGYPNLYGMMAVSSLS